MNTNLPQEDTSHPWILGSYAVYAPDLHIAYQVHDYVRSQPHPVPFGTVELETGETIDWINMRYDILRQGQSA